jgi:hypothetical protein
MNIRRASVALIIALAYEVLLKLSHTFAPALFHVPAVTTAVAILRVLVALVVILFLATYLGEEGADRRIAGTCALLIGCAVLRFIVDRSGSLGLAGFETVRLAEAALGSVQSALLLLLAGFSYRALPRRAAMLRRPLLIIVLLFAVGTVKSLYALITFARFVVIGTEAEFPALFHDAVLALFLLTHAAVILFLYRYQQAKSSAGCPRAGLAAHRPRVV